MPFVSLGIISVGGEIGKPPLRERKKDVQAVGRWVPPLAGEPLQAGAAGQGQHFFQGKPAEREAFVADGELGAGGGGEEEADVEVKVGRFPEGGPGRDFVDVQVKRHGGEDFQTFDAAFFKGFAPGDAQDVFVAVGMAAELHPAVELPVMVEEDLLAVGAQDEGAAGKVGGEGGPVKTVGGGIRKLQHPLPEGLFLGAPGEVEVGKQGSKWGPGH